MWGPPHDFFFAYFLPKNKWAGQIRRCSFFYVFFYIFFQINNFVIHYDEAAAAKKAEWLEQKKQFDAKKVVEGEPAAAEPLAAPLTPLTRTGLTPPELRQCQRQTVTPATPKLSGGYETTSSSEAEPETPRLHTARETVCLPWSVGDVLVPEATSASSGQVPLEPVGDTAAEEALVCTTAKEEAEAEVVSDTASVVELVKDEELDLLLSVDTPEGYDTPLPRAFAGSEVVVVSDED